MSAWDTVLLREVAESLDYGVTAAATWEPKGPKFLRITDIRNGSVDWDRVPWCESGDRAVNGSRLRPGDIVFARTGSTGKSLLIRDCPEEAVFASYLIRVRLNDAVDPHYMSYYLQTPGYWSQIASKSRGAIQSGVNASTLGALKFPLPPLAEQRRIASILGQLDCVRVMRRETLVQLDELAQSIFLDMFGDPSRNPRQWPEVRLGEAIERGPQNGLYKPSVAYGSGTPILRIDGFYEGAVNELGSLKRLQVSDDELRLYELLPGDIVINRVNSIQYLGKSAIVPELVEPVVFESNMMRLRIDRKLASPCYIVKYLQSEYVRFQILRSAKRAVNQASINQRDVKGIQIAIPPLRLQHQFAMRIEQVDRIKICHRAHLAELDALFASLQYRAFRGEL